MTYSDLSQSDAASTVTTKEIEAGEINKLQHYDQLQHHHHEEGQPMLSVYVATEEKEAIV